MFPLMLMMIFIVITHPTWKGSGTQNKRRIDWEMLDWRSHKATLLRSVQSKMHKVEKSSRKINNCKTSIKIRSMDALDLASSDQHLDWIFMIFSKQVSISVEPWFYSTWAFTQSTEAAWGTCLGNLPGGPGSPADPHTQRSTWHRTGCFPSPSTSLPQGLIGQTSSTCT